MNLGSRPCLVMLSAWGRPLQLDREMGTLRAVPILAERCSLDNRYVKLSMLLVNRESQERVFAVQPAPQPGQPEGGRHRVSAS